MSGVSRGATGTIRRDGRELAYLEVGVADGPCVIVHSAMPGSRLYGEMWAPAAMRRGVRVLALDRPGIGRSGFLAGRTWADTAADVSALALELGLERFDVVGVAEGAPHALACACWCGPGLRGAAVIGSPTPPELALQPSATGLAGVLLSRVVRTPWANRMVMGLVGLGARRTPGFILKQMKASGNDADRALLTRPEVRDLVLAAAADAFGSGSRGAAEEMALLAAPWRLPLERIQAPVHLWLEAGPPDGEANAPTLGSGIASATVHPEAELGALWLFDHADDVLIALGHAD